METKKEITALRDHIGKLAPKLCDITEKVLFDDVWERTELSKRDRSLATVAALVATGKTEQLDFHVPLAIKNGLKQEELVEMMTHLAFYVGWPSVMTALGRAQALFAKGAVDAATKPAPNGDPNQAP